MASRSRVNIVNWLLTTVVLLQLLNDHVKQQINKSDINVQPVKDATSTRENIVPSLMPLPEMHFWVGSFFWRQACRTLAADQLMAPQSPTLARTVVPVLLLWMICSLNASLVKVNKGLKVNRGQTAYLQEDDLQFHIPRQKDVCKVEVVLNEPITQRVGKLMPQVSGKILFGWKLLCAPGNLSCLLP